MVIRGLTTGDFIISDGGTQLTMNGGSDDFNFQDVLTLNAPYDVTVIQHPVGQTCTIESGSGTNLGADVEDVRIECALSKIFFNTIFFDF